ncbi:histidinol dehydrogenase [Paenibacillus xylaniclasticus]|uniref:histidinol dehydrogenase n=1 Tax=Paenibacillus xylaniclasticus TaxID=588083 RepID=UPI000FD75AD6
MQNSSLIFKIPEQNERLTESFKTHKTLFNREVLNGVLTIFDEVANKGDEGIRSMTTKYDGVDLNELVLSNDYVEECVSMLSPTLRSAIEQAINNVRDANLAMFVNQWTWRPRTGSSGKACGSGSICDRQRSIYNCWVCTRYEFHSRS